MCAASESTSASVIGAQQEEITKEPYYKFYGYSYTLLYACLYICTLIYNA